MTYTPNHPPWSWQKEAIEKMEGKDAFALLMAMRTGKTKTLLDDFGRLEHENKATDLLVIAPAGVYRTWEGALDDHLSEGLRKRTVLFTWSAGGKARDVASLVAFWGHPGPRVLLVNIEALSSVERARDLCQKFLSDRKAVLAIDESTTIKNPDAKRTKFVNRKLAPLAAYRRILSGLPTPRSPLDIYSQFEFLDPTILGFKSWFAFRARYAIMKPMRIGARLIRVVSGYQNTEELAVKIKPFSHRVLLEDCYELPAKVYSTREVSLTPAQKKAYAELKQFSTTQLASGEFVTATIVIAQMLRLHQVLCGHVGTEDGEVVSIPENRTKALLSLLNEFDGKAIVWASYGRDITNIKEKLEKEFGEGCVACFWGGNRSEREKEEKRFLTDPACRFMVATAAAGGRGRTWTVASLVVYYSNTADLEHRSQSEERAQGVGKTDPVAYVDLLTPGTVDERIILSLRDKIDMAATINGDNYREWLI